MAQGMLLRVVTYNVHGFKGCDFRIVPERVLAVLRAIDADCIALQEFVDAALPAGRTLLDDWAEALQMRGVYVPAFERGGDVFGNALLTRLEILEFHRHHLVIDGYRRRAFLDVVLGAERPVHVTVVHLGVSSAERALMTAGIEAMAEHARGDVQVWVGDFNEWRHSGVVSTALRRGFGSSPPLRTFPAVAPVLALDRIWVRPAHRLIESRVHTAPPARWASDHLPLIASIHVGTDD
jgi:endonuclease/exonuclease/phosphatase family metal-dependent hydrolase